MSYSFDTTAGASQSTVRPKLEGNKIHTVKLEDCKIEDIVGVKDPSMTYKVLKIIFSNDDAVYEHTVFEPKGDDFVRKETEFEKDGKVNKIPQPSNVESMMLLFKHVIDGFAPKYAEAIDSGKQSIKAKDWDELRKIVHKMLTAGKGNENKIKLLTNKNGEPVFPGFFAGLSKEGKAYVKNNFIGQKIAFTPYEIQRIQKEASAKPTKMEPSNFSAPANTTEDLDLNFDLQD